MPIPLLTRAVVAASIGLVIVWASTGHRSWRLVPAVCVVMAFVSAIPALWQFRPLAIAGVGLLSGVVVMTSSDVDIGLLDAAVLWFAGAIGFVVGYGAFVIAITATVIGFGVLKVRFKVRK